MRPGDILGRIFYVVTEINHRIIRIYPRSTRRTRIFLSTEDRIFLVATLEILEEMFFKMLLRKKYCGFTVYLQTKSLTKIFDYNALFLRVLPWARETIGLSARFCLCIKIFRRILTENAQQYVALLEGFIMDRLRLEILTIILKKILN